MFNIIYSSNRYVAIFLLSYRNISSANIIIIDSPALFLFIISILRITALTNNKNFFQVLRKRSKMQNWLLFRFYYTHTYDM